MGDKRLLEIATTINSKDGPLEIMAYITSLSNSDIYLLLQYIRSSKYNGMNFLNAITTFSRDYVKSKEILAKKNADSKDNGLNVEFKKKARR